MALSRTNRGNFTLTYDNASHTNPALSSSSFSPAGGSLLVAMVEEVTYGDASALITMSSTFSGQGAWTRYSSTLTDDGFGSYFRAYIFTSLCGGSPGSGTVTATSHAGSYIQGTFMEVIEVSGQSGSPVAQSQNAVGTGSSLALNFSTAPASTSYVFTNCIDGGSNTPTTPSGMTGLAAGAIPGPSWNSKHAEKLGSASQNNSWTSLGNFNNGGVAIEIAQATGGATAKRWGGVPFAGITQQQGRY